MISDTMTTIKLEAFRVKRSPSVNPEKHPAEEFELYSIPAFPDRKPEVAIGSEIGSSKKLVEPNTVLFSKINPRINRVWTVAAAGDQRQIASTEWIQFAPLPAVLPKYLQYFLMQHSIRDFVASNVSGVGGSLTRAQMSVLDDVTIPVPSPDEQQAIVEEIEMQFARLDDAESALRRAELRLSLFLSSVTQSSITSYIDPAEATNWTSLGEVADIKGGLTKGKKRKPEDTLYSVPYLRVANVQRGYLNLDEIKNIDATQAEIDQLHLLEGDILLNEGGDLDKLGRGWVWESQIPHCIHQNHVFRARVDKALYDPYFLSTYTNAFGQQYFMSVGSQTTNLASINKTNLSRLPLPKIPLEAQREAMSRIDRFTTTAGLERSVVQGNLVRLSSLRQAILKNAFEGNYGQ